MIAIAAYHWGFGQYREVIRSTGDGLGELLLFCIGVEPPLLVALSFLAVLPDEDRGPSEHARNEPPCGLQDQEEEENSRKEG